MFRGKFSAYGGAIIVAVLLFVVAIRFVEPAPPKKIRLATGFKSGTYYELGNRYRDILAKSGIEVEVLETQGSLDNIDALLDRSREIDIAFVQTGTGNAEEQENLRAIASLYYEPLWLFHRADLKVEALGALQGQKIAVGPEGSGTRAVARLLLEDNQIEVDDQVLVPLGSGDAAKALLNGEVDAAFFVSSPNSSYILELLKSDAIELMSFDRAEAYTKRHHYLSSVSLPEGIIELGANIPSRDISLLTPTATLVVHEDFHGALTQPLLAAAFEIHGPGGLLETPGAFPSETPVDFPLTPEARRYFKRGGPSFLNRILPFSVASLIERFVVLLLPFAALLFPLFKAVGPLLRWKIRSRIYTWYRDLLAVESELNSGETQKAFAELKRIEDEVSKVEVPLSYREELYNLRLHIQLIESKFPDSTRLPTS